MYTLKIEQGYERIKFTFNTLTDAVEALQKLEGNEIKSTTYTIEKKSAIEEEE